MNLLTRMHLKSNYSTMKQNSSTELGDTPFVEFATKMTPQTPKPAFVLEFSNGCSRHCSGALPIRSITTLSSHFASSNGFCRGVALSQSVLLRPFDIGRMKFAKYIKSHDIPGNL